MIFEETELQVAGLRLRRYAWRPAPPPRGGVAMIHGLGDYLSRYEHVARFFVARGFACEGLDLPGHGKSSGQRGHIPDWELLLELFDGIFRRLRGLVGDQVLWQGLFAHSLGAYAALDYLCRRPGQVRFAWLSSPLIQPSHGRPEWLLGLAEPLGKWLPRFPYRTGVRAAACVGPGAAGIEERKGNPWMHGWTTFGFGRALVLHEAAIRKALQSLNGDLELFVTHGTEDRVCPFGLSREVFEEIPLTRKRFVPVEGEGHEPLHGGNQQAVFAEAARWMEEVAGGCPP